MSATEGTLDVTTDPDLNASINEALADNGLSGEPGDDLAAGDGSSVEPTGSGEPLPRDDGVVPGASVAGAPAAPDPAAEPVSEPFRFDANGVERTEDGWRVFPGDGLYIPFTEMPRLQQAMSRIAASEAILRDAHTKTQEYDTLSSWQIKGPNGQPETITGPRALLERHAATAVLAATTSIYRNIFAGKPEEVAERLAGFYLQLPNGQVVANAQAIRNLQLEVQLAARDSDSRARAQFGNVSRGAPAAAPPSAPSQGNGNASPEVVTHLANGWGIQGLSTEDVPVLAGILPRYIRTATQDDVFKDPMLKVGQPVVMDEFKAIMQRLAAKVAQGKTAAKATDFNGRQNAGRPGQKPPVRPAAAPPPPPRNKRGRQPKGESFDDILARGIMDPEVQATLRGQ